MVRKTVFIAINIAIFIGLRYLNILHLFLRGKMGNNYQYSFWDYLPSFLIQVLILLLYNRFSDKKNHDNYTVVLSILTITFLYLLSHFRVIPNSVIPY